MKTIGVFRYTYPYIHVKLPFNYTHKHFDHLRIKNNNTLLIADYHIHSYGSFDSTLNISSKDTLLWILRKFINVLRIIKRDICEKHNKIIFLLCVVDHENVPLHILRKLREKQHFVENIFGSLLKEFEENIELSFKIIVGIEKKVELGEVLIYFPEPIDLLDYKLKHKILHMVKTCREFLHNIHRISKLNDVVKQSSHYGYVLAVPHPFKYRNYKLLPNKNINFIEVFNGRTGLKDNLKVLRLLLKGNMSKIPLCGSDAHIKNEILNSFTIVSNNFINLFYKIRLFEPAIVFSNIIAVLRIRDKKHLRNLSTSLGKTVKITLSREFLSWR